MSFGSQALIPFARQQMLLKAVGAPCPTLPAEESMAAHSRSEGMAGHEDGLSFWPLFSVFCYSTSGTQGQRFIYGVAVCASSSVAVSVSLLSHG